MEWKNKVAVITGAGIRKATKDLLTGVLIIEIKGNLHRLLER